MTPLLELREVTKRFGGLVAVDRLSVHVDRGELLGLIGPNGAGKSTLLDSILGLVRTTGEIRLDGVYLAGRSAMEIVRLGVGYAPERGHLFPFMGVRDNLLVGAYTAHRDAERNLEMVFDLFPVLRERQHQETGTQSGGERQMVTLGRALMSSPRLLIVDEPTIGLAPKVCLDIASAVRRMNAELGITILITEQNVNFATRLARDVHVPETGEIRMSGTADELMNDLHVREAYFGY